MHSHRTDKKTALDASMPRIERAIDEIKEGLDALADDPGNYTTQETYCVLTRQADALLRVTWADRGGHYREASLGRFENLMKSGLDLIRKHPAQSDDGRYKSKQITDSIRKRLAWLVSVRK